MQAVLRTACYLPRAGAVAVGTNNAAHFAELAGGVHLQVEEAVISRYRQLLRQRRGDQPA